MFELKRWEVSVPPPRRSVSLTGPCSAFHQQRLNRKRQAEIAKRNRERMRDPTFFPSVPKNLP